MSHRTHPTRSLTGRRCRSLGLRAMTAAASFAAFGLLATACSDSKTITGAETTAVSTTVAETTTTAVAETTTTVAETTTTVAETVPATDPPAPTVAPPPPPACADHAAPSGSAESVATITGDWNGDGVTDSAISWAEVSGGPQWFIRTEIAGGPASSVALGDLGVGFAQVVDRVDVDFSLGLDPGMNRDEFAAIAGSAASGVILNVFGVDDSGCVFRFDDGGGFPFEMPITGSVSYRSGLMCDGAAGSQFMVLKQAISDDDGTTFTTTDTKIVRTGARSLGFGVSFEGSLDGDDPELEWYSSAECFGTIWMGPGLGE